MPGVPESWVFWLGAVVGVLFIARSGRIAYLSFREEPVMSRTNPFYREVERPNGTLMQWDVRWTRRTVLAMLAATVFVVFCISQTY